MNNLYQRSINIIIENQSSTGAFLACPHFTQYQYSWFRDGSFCAHALLQAGHIDNAAAFHQWASQVILQYENKITRCIHATQLGDIPPANECLHSRFTVEGIEVPGNWGHHQLDGVGTWLWSLTEFIRKNTRREVPEEWLLASRLAKDYLISLWSFPCSDCWEENETLQHTYSLAAVFAGLAGYGELFNDPVCVRVSSQIRTFVLENCVKNERFIKSIGIPGVDANLIGVSFPYGIVDWNDDRFQNTLSLIHKQLATPTGVHRYLDDTYYGGGEWLLLTGWLGWGYSHNRCISQAREILVWMEKQATSQGELPEQVPHNLFDKTFYPDWIEKWGEIASPLLWSHAMYILLCHDLENQ